PPRPERRRCRSMRLDINSPQRPNTVRVLAGTRRQKASVSGLGAPGWRSMPPDWQWPNVYVCMCTDVATPIQGESGRRRSAGFFGDVLDMHPFPGVRIGGRRALGVGSGRQFAHGTAGKFEEVERYREYELCIFFGSYIAL